MLRLIIATFEYERHVIRNGLNIEELCIYKNSYISLEQ